MQPREGLNLKIPGDLKRALERAAKNDKRSLNNLVEVLLEWSHQQLQFVDGNASALVKREIQSPSSTETQPQRGEHEHSTRPSPARRRAGSSN